MDIKNIDIEKVEWCKVCAYNLKDGFCQICAETQAKIEAKVYSKLDSLTFDTFRPTDKNRTAREAALKATKADNFYIWGPTGRGKTHLACAIVNKLFKTRYYHKALSVCRALRACQEARDEVELIQKWTTSDNLILDEFGLGNATIFMVQTIYEIVDGREENMKGGLIITSNLNLNDLAKYLNDDRIPSRISGFCKILSLDGERDFRVRK